MKDERIYHGTIDKSQKFYVSTLIICIVRKTGLILPSLVDLGREEGRERERGRAREARGGRKGEKGNCEEGRGEGGGERGKEGGRQAGR